MLTDVQIEMLESVAVHFEGIENVERACRQYRHEMAALKSDSWKMNLAMLERLNPAAYQKVLATIPTSKQAELAAFVSQYKDKAIPTVQVFDTLSAAKLAKPGVVVVKP